MVFCRASIARNSGGQTNLMVKPISAANTSACETSDSKLTFMLPPGCPSALAEPREQRVAGGEPQRQADADDERGVDQAEQQEHLALQRVGELRLARGGFEEAAAHDADADAGAERAEADHQADADAGVGLHHGDELEFFHCFSLSERSIVIRDARAPSPSRRR